MDDQLNRLLLETSGDPERITDLLQAIAIELSESSEAAGTMVEPVLENFYLAMNLAAKLCQTTADKSRLEAIVENMPMAMLIVSPEKSFRQPTYVPDIYWIPLNSSRQTRIS